jgi:hypothetical protein
VLVLAECNKVYVGLIAYRRVLQRECIHIIVLKYACRVFLCVVTYIGFHIGLTVGRIVNADSICPTDGWTGVDDFHVMRVVRQLPKVLLSRSFHLCADV